MHVLILGCGETGLAMARWLARGGHRLRVADTRAEPPGRAALRAQLPAAEFVAGPLTKTLLDGIDLVALGPGLSPTQSDARVVVAEAQRRKIDLVGEIELFARALAELEAERAYAPRIVGITGTNGKTTVTRLTGLLLERAGLAVAVAGNISPSALEVLAERLDAGALPEVWVLELSSFQLATTRSLQCAVATVLNVTQDHLDWHGTMDAYIRAKARIFAKDTVQVVNRDDATTVAMLRKSGRPLSFGGGVPTQPEQYGLVQEGGLTWLAYAEDLAPSERRRRAAAELPGIDAPVHLHKLMPTEALHIRGRHNALNALAALALARALGCPLAPLLHALRGYRGEPHRVELIATRDGVEFYDDSKGTNVGATVAALDGLGTGGKRLVAILGGDGKGQDFAPLVAPLARHARAVVLIGRDGPKIGDVLAAAPYPVQSCATLEQAVAAAIAQARSGDAVLLSPACASLDMFRDYTHRAEVFVRAVRAAPQAAAALEGSAA